jgi:diacylglycerol O-acyltransferase
MAEFMQNSDAFTWAMEHEPGLRSTVVTIFLLDRSPDWDVLRDRFDRISRTLPMFRQRVVPSVPPAPPRWELASDFDLGYHIRRVTAPTPGSFDSVLEMARLKQMDDFDRARPLWEVTLIEGLADGAAAVLIKLHHALTDGVGGVEVAMALFDVSRAGSERGPLPPHPEAEERDVWAAWRDSARYDVGLLRAAARAAVRSVPLGARGLLTPVASARAVGSTLSSVYRTVRPINQTGSELMRDRRLVRKLGVHEVPLRELKAAGKSVGGTLNDAFLGGITGGMRLYHDRHGHDVDELHVCMPVNIRNDGDPMGGNRITLMRFDLPVDVPDPAERIRRIHERAGFVRSERSLPYTQLIAGALNLMPRPYIASILQRVDFLASDVPGIPVPVYLGGAKVLMQYPFGPTIGAGVNVTLMSYVDTCALGINVDTGAIPDYDVFHECLVDGFEEVLELGAAAVPA